MKTDGIADASTACGLRVAGEGGEWAGAVASVTVHVCKTRGRHLVASRSGEARAPGGRTQKGRFAGTYPPNRAQVDGFQVGAVNVRVAGGQGRQGTVARSGCCFWPCRGCSKSTQRTSRPVTRGGVGPPGRNWQTGLRPTVRQLAGPDLQGIFAQGAPCHCRSSIRQKSAHAFSRRAARAGTTACPIRPDHTRSAPLRPPRFRLDQTRPDSGKSSTTSGDHGGRVMVR